MKQFSSIHQGKSWFARDVTNSLTLAGDSQISMATGASFSHSIRDINFARISFLHFG